MQLRNEGQRKGSFCAGFDGDEATERSEVDEHDIDVSVYKAYWKLNGEVMSIEVRARDGSNRISITVKYSPED